jgi:hypothetical protein
MASWRAKEVGMRPRKGFEFVYLSVLTRRKVKPLSRWEAQFGRAELNWLRDLGLQWQEVRRVLLSGDSRAELVFSLESSLLREYVRSFDGKPVLHSPEEMRLEGRLFGYPECCVESFIERGYAPNDLSPADQQLLFHWACPGCKVTPGLLPHYRACYEEARGLAQGFRGAPRRRSPARIWMPLAASSFAILAGPALGQSIDPHRLPLPDSLDTNRNFLLDRYEEALVKPTLPLDGVELALRLAAAIDSLPTAPQVAQPYRIDRMARGLEACSVCDSLVNMGFVRIVNPSLNDSLDLPYLALHTLWHGSLDFAGQLHRGRVNLLRLIRILDWPYAVHTLPFETELDADGDGIADTEEARLGLDPSLADANTNRIVDGPELAVNWAAELEALPSEPLKDRPYRVDHPMRGIETCEVCGETVNMGYFEVINPAENFRLELPYIALHALKHGSFVYAATLHDGQLSARSLSCALHADGSFHQQPVQDDSDKDGLADLEEGHLGTNPLLPDTDGDGIPDGRALAWRLAEALDKLPKEPREAEPYRIDYPQHGLEVCEVCGQSVNMGFVCIVNPVRKDSVDLPYMALHSLEHGAFTAQGTIHTLRADPVRLCRLLGLPTSVPRDETSVPGSYRLLGAFPNPMSDGGTEVRIEMLMPVPAEAVQLEIFDLLGRRIRTLRLSSGRAGIHKVVWDGRDDAGKPAPTGLYFCRLRAQRQIGPTLRLLLLR